MSKRDASKTDTSLKKTASFSEEQAQKIAEDFANFGFDPSVLCESLITFGKALTGINLYVYQQEFIYRVFHSVITKSGETITALWSRQSGKTESVAFIVDTLTVIMPTLAKVIPLFKEYEAGFWIGLFAPQSDQVTTTYNRCLKGLKSKTAEMIMKDSEINTDLMFDAKLTLSNGSFLLGQTASKTSKIESKTYHLVFIEEAQDTDDLVISKSIEPMMTSTFGTICKVGTTGTRKGDFFYEIQRNVKRESAVKDYKLRYHFEFDYRKVIKYKKQQYLADGNRFHLNYENFIKVQIDKRGEDSDSFKLSYALRWALDSGMFITDSEFVSLLNKKKVCERVVQPDWDMRAGIDIAKDNASTVITLVRSIVTDETKPPTKEIIGWVELDGMNYEEQHHTIVQTLVDYNVNTVFIDYTGVGKPVVDRLVAASGNYISYYPYTFSRPSKSDMWVALRADIEQKRIVVPAHETTRNSREYKSFETQLKGAIKYFEGGYLVANKSDDKYYDDYLDSLGLAVLAGNREAANLVEVTQSTGNPMLSRGGNQKLIEQSSW